MCGLLGFLHYGNNKLQDLSTLTNSLTEQSAVRGMDATGIAFCNSTGMKILKENKSAYKVQFKHSDEIVAMTGHTRHSTQGSEKKNYNNHPFYGRTQNARFALAHNGVLCNDEKLRKQYSLPKTKIETDSFVAVQLIESQRKLDFDSLKYMAERTEGSFSYSILDDENNIWLVKGDSPLSILHFPNLKIYVYASTDEILYKALVDYSPLFSALKNGEFEAIDISEGDILKICHDGRLKRNTFNFSYYFGKGWWDYGSFKGSGYMEYDYVEDLKAVASMNGYSPEDIDHLLEQGFMPEEIEEYIYCGLECEI